METRKTIICFIREPQAPIPHNDGTVIYESAIVRPKGERVIYRDTAAHAVFTLEAWLWENNHDASDTPNMTPVRV